MKLKLLLIAVLAVLGLYFVNQYLNTDNRSRGSTAPDVADADARPKFKVGFLPVT